MKTKETTNQPASAAEERTPLERFIKNNLPAFDEEPASGHYERQAAARERAKRFVVLKRYARQKAQREKGSPYLRKAAFFAIAASVTAVMLSIFFTLHDRTPAVRQETVVLCENAADMKSCYFGKMNDVATQIREMAEILDNIDPQEVMIEVDNLLATGDDIELEIPEELPDDAAKTVLLNYYKQHLESLQSIAERLAELKMES